LLTGLAGPALSADKTHDLGAPNVLVPIGNLVSLASGCESGDAVVRCSCRLTWWALVGLFRSRRALEAENPVLRQQINVLRRTAPKRLLISSIDRLILVGLYRLFPNVRGALVLVKPP